jgi:predicted amidohydrolase
MTHEVSFAVVQMDAKPDLTSNRLKRAEKLVSSAAEHGAQLVLLPELFNSGYQYSDENYNRAEKVNGVTVTWMQSIARQNNIFLAGSLLLYDNSDIYNSMLLNSPEGETWRYDKNYPWIWERAYFKGGSDITIANTKLGRFGMMVCWDVAHRELWAKYSGKVDAMLICSCPPAIHNLTLLFPDGNTLTSQSTGFLMRIARDHASETFDQLLRHQAALLKLPVAISGGTGKFSTRIPGSRISLLSYVLLRPAYWKYLSMAGSIIAESDYFDATYLTDQEGSLLSRVSPFSEGYAMQSIQLSEGYIPPVKKQPAYGLSSLIYGLDRFAQIVMAVKYKQNIRTLRRQ